LAHLSVNNVRQMGFSSKKLQIWDVTVNNVRQFREVARKWLLTVNFVQIGRDCCPLWDTPVRIAYPSDIAPHQRCQVPTGRERGPPNDIAPHRRSQKPSGMSWVSPPATGASAMAGSHLMRR
jgi:hypothetical protein